MKLDATSRHPQMDRSDEFRPSVTATESIPENAKIGVSKAISADAPTWYGATLSASNRLGKSLPVVDSFVLVPRECEFANTSADRTETSSLEQRAADAAIRKRLAGELVSLIRPLESSKRRSTLAAKFALLARSLLQCHRDLGSSSHERDFVSAVAVIEIALGPHGQKLAGTPTVSAIRKFLESASAAERYTYSDFCKLRNTLVNAGPTFGPEIEFENVVDLPENDELDDDDE